MQSVRSGSVHPRYVLLVGFDHHLVAVQHTQGLSRPFKLNCKRFALPASAQPTLREGSGTPKSSVGKVRIPEAGSRQVRQAGLAWLGWATG